MSQSPRSFIFSLIRLEENVSVFGYYSRDTPLERFKYTGGRMFLWKGTLYCSVGVEKTPLWMN